MGRKKKTESTEQTTELTVKQAELPGTERKRNKKLESKILYYIEKRDKRMAATKLEVEAKAALMSGMVEAGYKPGDAGYTMVDGETEHTCKLSSDEVKPKVTSKGPKADKDEDDGGDEIPF